MPPVLLGQNDVSKNTPVNDTSGDETTHQTAFMVLVKKDGSYVVDADINKIVIPEKPATQLDIKNALHNVLSSMTAQETAMAIMALQMEMAMQAQSAQMNQQVKEMLAKGKK